jgi:hypothetical protein
MSILWQGGEDIDFPNGGGVFGDTTAGVFRAGYARCGIEGTTASPMKSTLFPGGAITSAWVSARIYSSNEGTGMKMVGFGLSGTTKGLFIGLDATTLGKVALIKYDGTTATQLAAEAGVSFPNISFHRLDMQVINYGATATVNVYWDLAFLFTFTGDVTVTGMTNFDSVFLWGINSSFYSRFSEIIVANEDTRSFSLLTMAPISAGTTDQWTGLFSAVNPTTVNDANSNFTNTVAQDQQYNVTAVPSGTFAVRQLKVNARMSATAGSTATRVATGFNLSGTVSVGAPSAALGTAFINNETYFANNPVTTAAWTQTQLNTIQVDMRSS